MMTNARMALNVAVEANVGVQTMVMVMVFFAQGNESHK